MSILRETEEQLAGFSPMKRLLVALIAVSMTVAGGWYLWIENTERGIEEASARNAELQRQIARTDLRRLSKKIEQVRHKRLVLLEKVHDSNAAVKYLRSQLEGVGKVRFDQERVADLLDAVLKKSSDYGLRVDKIESVDDIKEVTPLLERKKILNIEGAGSFERIIGLTHYIESLDMLTKIEMLDIYLDSEGATAFRMKIFAYGEKL